MSTWWQIPQGQKFQGQLNMVQIEQGLKYYAIIKRGISVRMSAKDRRESVFRWLSRSKEETGYSVWYEIKLLITWQLTLPLMTIRPVPSSAAGAASLNAVPSRCRGFPEDRERTTCVCLPPFRERSHSTSLCSSLCFSHSSAEFIFST